MKIRFLPVEKQVVVGILGTLENKLAEREIRRRIAFIKSKFESTAFEVRIKKGELGLVQRLIEVALEQAKKLEIENNRIDDIKLVHATISNALGEAPHAPDQAS